MDEDIEIINTQTRNEKIKNFFINNKNSLISILVIIILALIGYFSFEEYQSSKREKLADKYDLAVIRYEADNKYNVIPDLKEVINAKDKTYSPLAFYFLLDNDLISSKDEKVFKQKIISNFNKLFEENSVVNKLTFDEKISIMKWRASQPSGCSVPLSLQFSKKYRIGFCGDWFEGEGFGRIEGSILSALILAEKFRIN